MFNPILLLRTKSQFFASLFGGRWIKKLKPLIFQIMKNEENPDISKEMSI